jgi:hypothetical protein
MHTGRPAAKRQANVKSLYRKWAETNQSVYYVEAEEIVVADRFIASVACICQQVSGKSLTGRPAVSHLPYVLAERVVERSRFQKGFLPDKNATYLYKSVFQTIWLYGERCRPVAGDLWEPDPEKSELIELDPADVLTTQKAAELLAPFIKPLPTFEEAVLGMPSGSSPRRITTLPAADSAASRSAGRPSLGSHS